MKSHIAHPFARSRRHRCSWCCSAAFAIARADAQSGGAGSSALHMSRPIWSRCSANISVTRCSRSSIDLIWGYGGILSLGHGAFFALGGYAMGMYLMRQIGTRGVYANPILPDFMVFLNWKELPIYLVRLPALRLCGADGRAGAGRARFRVRLVCLPQPRHRRLSVDHHAGADLRADARIFPQQFRLRRQ